MKNTDMDAVFNPDQDVGGVWGAGSRYSDGDRNSVYIAIDMKSFYASVECVQRGLDPLTTNLLVADESRTDQTICLAVSPSLKAIGVPSRPRLFEAKQAIAKYEQRTHKKVEYIAAMPRMGLYEQVSAQIYSVYLRYVAPEDVHVYSIDEVFIDCTPYLEFYAPGASTVPPLGASDASDASTVPASGIPPSLPHLETANAAMAGESGGSRRPGAVEPPHPRELENVLHPAHVMATTIIRDVLKTTGITATVGIGTNLYLAKVAMDIVAKKAAPDKDGVRIAELNELSYCYLLWDHKPLTDFWQVGPGKARRLQKNCMFTMGDIADRSQWDEAMFYKEFGIDGEILIDHAWGIEPVTMADIKNYRSGDHSISNGQVLPKPYEYKEARVAFAEMIDLLCADMYKKNVICKGIVWWVSYDYKSMEHCPEYDGPTSIDFYGRLHPKHSKGTVRLSVPSNSHQVISREVLEQFDRKTDHRLLYRRLGVNAIKVREDSGVYQLNLFTDYEALEKERRIQGAMLEIRQRFGRNAVLKGINLLDGAMTRERNEQIGGHKA